MIKLAMALAASLLSSLATLVYMYEVARSGASLFSSGRADNPPCSMAAFEVVLQPSGHLIRRVAAAKIGM
ncbi:MAG: hypothetical protein ACRDOO_09180, partial [Actinomadura sp.]